jgi:3-deoxy-7-phosphoheptulonate synthase
VARIKDLDYQVHISQGEERTIIGIVGDGRPIDRDQIERMAGVEKTVPILRPFKLASRDFHSADIVVKLNGIEIGGRRVIIMAGPCSVESREQLLETAHAVKEAGATVLRGGAFKPRTSPYSFQGLGEQGLKILAEAREQTGLLVVTEVMAPEQVPLVSTYADILQIGARNMQNYALLHAVGEAHKPVLLKRGMMSTMEELLMSAEYILSHGNNRVMLCERGIRTFETYTRNTLDINAVPLLKQLSPLPVVVDPSHGTGKWKLVGPTALAALAAGADGLMLEVHPRPDQALSDGAQSLKPERFATLVEELARVATAVDRTI